MLLKVRIPTLVLFSCFASVAHAQVPAPPVGGSGTPNFVAKFTGHKSIGNTKVAELEACMSKSDTALLTGDVSIAALLCLRDPDPGNSTPKVTALASSPTDAAIWGLNNSPTGGDAPHCVAGLFNAIGGGDILVGTGFNAFTAFRVDAYGDVFANSYNVGGADFAESMAVSGERNQYEPGDLLVIDALGSRQAKLSDRAYSPLVAGIYSTKPGVLASPYKMDDPNLAKEVPLAIVGIVPCKVSAENGPIEVGDLLVASSTPSHAMRGTDRSRMLGAVVGKALERLREDKGVIQVLVTLQ